MKDQEKQPYEPPKVTVVPVQLEERVLGCNFSTVKNCGLTE
jgi:hypothetical protein